MSSTIWLVTVNGLDIPLLPLIDGELLARLVESLEVDAVERVRLCLFLGQRELRLPLLLLHVLRVLRVADLAVVLVLALLRALEPLFVSAVQHAAILRSQRA